MTQERIRRLGVLTAALFLSSAACGDSKKPEPPPRVEQRAAYGNAFIGFLDDIKPWLETNCDKLGSTPPRAHEYAPQYAPDAKRLRWICEGPWKNDTFSLHATIESSDQDPAPVYYVYLEVRDGDGSFRNLARKGFPLIKPLLLPDERVELERLLTKPAPLSAALSDEVEIGFALGPSRSSLSLSPRLDMDGEPARPSRRRTQ